ncbi:MAG TPA: Uma2 family endonuclease [Polyangia bacterium]|nr:Uma2 family endonuclease [Polyangia bacterium]
MSRGARAHPSATAADLLAIPEARRFHEIVGGELVEKAAPSGEHGTTQAAVAGSLFGPFSRPAGGGVPGWWFGTEVEIELETHEIYRPDVAGWRRDRAPQRPTGIPVHLRPDWICEILSPSTARNDQITKLETYRRCAVPHYWIIDPQQLTLLIYRLTPDGYLLALTADANSGRIRAEPFEAIEIEVAVLLGGDPEDDR